MPSQNRDRIREDSVSTPPTTPTRGMNRRFDPRGRDRSPPPGTARSTSVPCHGNCPPKVVRCLLQITTGVRSRIVESNGRMGASTQPHYSPQPAGRGGGGPLNPRRGYPRCGDLSASWGRVGPDDRVSGVTTATPRTSRPRRCFGTPCARWLLKGP